MWTLSWHGRGGNDAWLGRLSVTLDGKVENYEGDGVKKEGGIIKINHIERDTSAS